MNKMKEAVVNEIDNFILYFTSNEKERKQMREVLDDFEREVLVE